METIPWQSWVIIIVYGVIGISTSILMNSWSKRYYRASTLAAALSAIIFAIIIALLPGDHRSEGEIIMLTFFAYIFFIPLTFTIGALVKLFQ